MALLSCVCCLLLVGGAFIAFELLTHKTIDDGGDAVQNSTVLEETTGISFPILLATDPPEVALGVTVFRPDNQFHDELVICAGAAYVENTDTARTAFQAANVTAGSSSGEVCG